MWVFWGTSLYLVQPSDLRQVGNWAWGNGDQIKAAVGNHFSLLGQDLDALKWRLGIDGGVFMTFEAGGPLTFHLQTVDGTFGVPIDLRMDRWHFRSEWRHDSAHFGDGIRISGNKPPAEALDSLSYESLALYIGYNSPIVQPQLACRVSTTRNGTACKVGTTVLMPNRDSSPYLASTIRQASGVFGGPSLSAQIGYLWSEAWTFRTGIQWYNGAHDAGKLSDTQIRFLGFFMNWNTIGSV